MRHHFVHVHFKFILGTDFFLAVNANNLARLMHTYSPDSPVATCEGGKYGTSFFRSRHMYFPQRDVHIYNVSQIVLACEAACVPRDS
jgi:hypothetical protein